MRISPYFFLFVIYFWTQKKYRKKGERTSDEQGNLLSETETLTRKGGTLITKMVYEYDLFGKVTSETVVTEKEQNGVALPQIIKQTSYRYDVLGNPTETTVKQKQVKENKWQEQTTRSEYNLQGQLIKSYDDKGIKENYATLYEYDLNGRVIQTKTPIEKTGDGVSYGIIKNEYDTDGNPVMTEELQSDGKWVRTEYEYDKLGQLVLVKNCMEGDEAQYTQYAYDVEGNKIRQYTGMTKPLSITVAEGEAQKAGSEKKSASEAFTCQGKSYHIEVSGGSKKNVYSEVKYEYNKRNELVRMTDGEGRMESYSYDEEGNLVTTVDKNRNSLTNTYDNQGRLRKQEAKSSGKASVTEAETVTHTYEYDDYGDLIGQDNQTFTYQDVSGNLTEEMTKEAGRKSVTKSYTYDTEGNRLSMCVHIGEEEVLSCRYGYDGLSRLTKVGEGTGKETFASYTYDVNGNLATLAYPQAGISTEYTYDAGNRVTGIVSRKAGEKTKAESSLSSDVITYWQNGQIRKRTSQTRQAGEKEELSTGGVTYRYDCLGRLVTEKADKQTIEYSYDSFNNRKEMKTGNRVTAYRYNKNNELLRTDELNTKTKQDKVTAYRYDKNGNQLGVLPRETVQDESEPVVGMDISLGDNRLNENAVTHYNALNQPVRTLTKDSKVSYAYNADGLRTKKTVNGKETTYVWDGDQLILELDSKDKVIKRYIRGNQLIYADNGVGADKTYYLYNSHGDVVQLTDEEGNITKTYEYDSFGNEVKPDKKDDNPFRYSGEYYDKETGTIYLRARRYEPATGRFTTCDSYTGEEDDPLSLHLYTYCENDGVNQVDPSGHDAMLLLKTNAGGVTRQGHMALVFQVLEKNKKKQVYFFSLNRGSSVGGAAATDISFVALGYLPFKWKTMKESIESNAKLIPMVPYYNEHLYLKGNFSKAKKFLEPDTEGNNRISYNLLTNNCMQVVMDALEVGKFKEYDSDYKMALGYARELKSPMKAFYGLEYFKSKIKKYKKQSWIKKLFGINDPYVALRGDVY